MLLNSAMLKLSLATVDCPVQSLIVMKQVMFLENLLVKP